MSFTGPGAATEYGNTLYVLVGQAESQSLSHPEHLHHLIPQMIDDLHRNAPRLRLFERPRHIAVQRCPRFLIHLGLQSR